jgi:phosphonopyruvate decarboxylase
LISPKDFIDALKAQRYGSFTGVPCSFFQASISYVLDRPDLRYTIVPNEGSAMALAAGAWLAGERTAIFIQNSGFGNLVNPLTSLQMIYGIPALVFMSGRAYGVKDEPQHEVIGGAMGAALDALGVKHEDMPQDIALFRASLETASHFIEEKGRPFFFFVKKGTLEEYSPDKRPSGPFPMKRIDAIRAISECLSGDENVVATTGKPSRELFTVADRPKNFYMQGSMGHAPSIGLGIALAKPGQKVVVLDGDGALLMHLGVLSSVGHYKPSNFYHVVLDNESYETTGGQLTTSANTDFAKAALACGYHWAGETKEEASLRELFRSMLQKPGPALLRVKINREATEGIPRISSKYSSAQIARHFKEALA